MARILISAPAGIFDDGEYRLAVFYDGLIKSLQNRGNEVRAINSFNFLIKPWGGENKTLKSISNESLNKSIKDFDPEIIIAFNHSIPQTILDNTNCPVIVWDADSIQFYNDKDYILKNLERYIFLCFSHAGYKNALKFGAPKNKTHVVLAGTGLCADDIPQDKNISFIGTDFSPPQTFIELLYKHGAEKINPVIDALSKDFYSDQNAIIKEMNAEWLTEDVDIYTLTGMLLSTQLRNSVLNDIQDLGLSIYGRKNWYQTGRVLPRLALSYRDQLVYTAKHNQDIYNSSKICINICHFQVKDGFPWRILDIMATNGCLVSDKETGISEFTKGYVDIPMYENQREAYELCQKILKDDAWRKDIVAGSQACIQEKGRWENRFAELSEITGVNFEPYKIKGETDNFSLNDISLHPKDFESSQGKLVNIALSLSTSLFSKKILIRCYYFLSNKGIKIPDHILKKAKDLKEKIK